MIEEYKRNELDIVIDQDTDPENPREWDNVGVMFCSHRRYTLGDEQFNADNFEGWEDVEKYLRKERKAVIVLPLSLHDHSGISMSVGDYCGWDTGQVGFIYCTQADIDEAGWTLDNQKEMAEKLLIAEVETYDQYLTGDVYGYTITNPKNGEVIDSLSGIFGMQYAREEANAVADRFIHPTQAAYAKKAVIVHG